MDSAALVGQVPAVTLPSRVERRAWFRAAILTLVGILAAWSWLFVVSKWGPANRIDILTFKAGLTSQIMRTLLRQGQGTGHHSHASTMMSGVYATPTYFAMTEQAQEADTYLPDRFTVFYLFEDIHVGEISRTAPLVWLRLADGRQIQPLDREVLRDSFHHRATVVRFPKVDTASLTLVAHDPQAHIEQTMTWNLPIVYPKDLQEGTELSLATLVALLAGLLAVLSPCLLQLTVYYTFALAGMSMQAAAGSADARGRVIRTALYFIAGFTIVFTAAGSLAGLAGEKLQTSGLMEAWNRPLAIAAGVGILLLGIWVGANSGAPGVCRLPSFARRANPRGFAPLEPSASGANLMRFAFGDGLKAMFLGSAFAIGCSTCFGGALFISLMIYVGAVGSASLGALALFLFSLGIAIPYLVAAFFLSRALPMIGSLQRAASGVGLVCSVVLTFFGVILITDNFHIPSDFLYRVFLANS
jgi:cytochrome c-type biogenesis protein